MMGRLQYSLATSLLVNLCYSPNQAIGTATPIFPGKKVNADYLSNLCSFKYAASAGSGSCKVDDGVVKMWMALQGIRFRYPCQRPLSGNTHDAREVTEEGMCPLPKQAQGGHNAGDAAWVLCHSVRHPVCLGTNLRFYFSGLWIPSKSEEQSLFPLYYQPCHYFLPLLTALVAHDFHHTF